MHDPMCVIGDVLIFSPIYKTFTPSLQSSGKISVLC